MIGETVIVTVDRPMGSYHPVHKNLYYPVNYGYVEGIVGGDGEWQDAYILGVDIPVDCFVGEVIAIVCRTDDIEEKWVVVPKGKSYTAAEIQEMVDFQEKFFDFEILMEE